MGLDTLLMGTSGSHLNEFLNSTANADSTFGMELHWGKFQLLQVQNEIRVLQPNGREILAKEGMEYLYPLIHIYQEVVSGAAKFSTYSYYNFYQNFEVDDRYRRR